MSSARSTAIECLTIGAVIGRVAGGGLVAHQHVPDRAVQQRVVERQARIARHAEDRVDPGPLERGDQGIGAAHRCLRRGRRAVMDTAVSTSMGRPFGREDDEEGCRAAERSAGYVYADEHALGALKSVGVACGHGPQHPIAVNE
jgi:hypothetical protein